MITTIKNFLACFLLYSLILSCKKETAKEIAQQTNIAIDKDLNNQSKAQNEVLFDGQRLEFKNADSYFQFIADIENGKITKEDLNKFKQAGFKDLFSKIKEKSESENAVYINWLKEVEEFHFPEVYKVVLNTEMEVVIAGTINKFDNGSKYFIPKGKSYSKANLGSFKNVSLKNNPIRINSRIQTPGGYWSTANYQKEFYATIPSYPGWKKFVQGLESFIDYVAIQIPTQNGFVYGYTFGARLYLNIKEEWKDRRRWRPATDTKNIQYNITKNITLRNERLGIVYINQTFNGTISENVTTTDDNYQVLLAGRGGNTVESYVYWDLELNGRIYQYLIGDNPANAYDNIRNPLW